MCAIHEVQRIISPLMNGESVERSKLVHARDLFMEVVKNIRFTIDPDRPVNNYELVLSLDQARADDIFKNPDF